MKESLILEIKGYQNDPEFTLHHIAPLMHTINAKALNILQKDTSLQDSMHKEIKIAVGATVRTACRRVKATATCPMLLDAADMISNLTLHWEHTAKNILWEDYRAGLLDVTAKHLPAQPMTATEKGPGQGSACSDG